MRINLFFKKEFITFILSKIIKINRYYFDVYAINNFVEFFCGIWSGFWYVYLAIPAYIGFYVFKFIFGFIKSKLEIKYEVLFKFAVIFINK